ncbi:MAG: FtsW/RodA/SpoVE family cell cycle protein, partial [Tissierella sp.]|uniref:FtsW/RodA/SpoVE family cell cycle protein n=1 Tax=Tissierella sp. TaxID=41274 RepID=UPI003F9B93E9
SGLFFAIPLFIALTSASTASVILYSLSCLILLTIAIAKGWFNVNKLKALLLVYIPTTILSSTVFLVAVVNNSYRMKMFLNIIDPASDKMGSGWIVTNIREILASSKLIGQNKAIEASLILPEINTNYILTFLIHRLGWLAFLVVVGVVTTFIVRSFILSSKQKSMLGTLISTSVLITFTMQVVFYIISNLGIVLIAPLALPFIAYSGSSIVINMILIGIMLSVFKSGDLVKDNLLERQGRRDKFFEVVDGKIIIDLNLK